MIIGNKVRLRFKRLADAHNDYNWGRDHELSRLDAVAPLTMSLDQFLIDYTRELHHPSLGRHLFSIETSGGQHIGSCVYYNVNEYHSEAELGILIGNREYWNRGYGTDTITTLLGHIFNQTKLNRIHLKTLQSNVRAQKCFGKCGFIPCGYRVKGGNCFILMEILRTQWQQRDKNRQNVNVPPATSISINHPPASS
jgi:RimJ/RimL family protein N-acetyltransferase